MELDVSGPAGRLEVLSLRLYNPQSRQWSLHAASGSSGTLFPPMIGEFTDGRGEFYGQETLNGRAILVRFVISEITPDSWRFEQAFSDDGGKSWEVNWIAVDTWIGDATDGRAETPRPSASASSASFSVLLPVAAPRLAAEPALTPARTR